MSSRIARLTLFPFLAALALSGSGAAAASYDVRAPAAAASPLAVPVRVGTYNIQSNRTLDQFEAGVDELEQRVDVAGLQEIGSNEKSRYLRDSLTWGYYRPVELQQNPIIWDRSDFRLDEGKGYLLARGRDVGDENPVAGRIRDDSYATVVHLVHLQTGQVISVINVHLLSGAVKGGRAWPGRPRMFALYRAQVRALVRVYRAEVADGQVDRVFVLGDLNVGYKADRKWHKRRLPYRRLTRQGLVSMWHDHDVERGGTHNDAYIDQVWTTEPVVKGGAEVAYDIRESDHSPAIATYLFDPLS